MNSFMNFMIGGGQQADGTVLFGAIFFTFMFMFFFVLAVMDIVERRNDIRKRATWDSGLDYTVTEPDQSLDGGGRSLRYQSFAANTALLAKVERGQRNQRERETERSKLERELVSAGFFGPHSILWFQGIRLSLLVGFPLVLHIAISLTGTAFQSSTHLGILAAAGGIGFLLPGRYLVQRQKSMRQQCQNGFPDFMDLMVVCAEAGLSPRAAIDRISREISNNYPYLGANLYLMSLELRAGSSLADAVESLARRTAVEEVINLGSLLNQTEQLGTSLTEALRIYSDEMRDKRLSRAEEKAHALPVKLTLPLGLFIFPVMLVVIGLPIFIRIKNALF
jgi:tight adherence protein C